MSQHVVTLNAAADITIVVGVETGVTRILTGPDGTRAVFNDPADRDFVGYIEVVSGFDSPEVRESADLLVEGDGGVHGNFYFGRRPWTIEGLVWPDPDQATVNARIDRIDRASRALRANSTLTWSASGGMDVQLTGRLQQPLRITDRRPKRFQVAMVAADPRIYSQIRHSQSVAANPGTLTLTNNGDAGTPPLITLRGDWVNPVITNQSTGESIALTITTVAGDVLVIDTLAKTVLLNATNRYSAVNFTTTNWWELAPGKNNIAVTPTSGTGSYEVAWRDAWT